VLLPDRIAEDEEHRRQLLLLGTAAADVFEASPGQSRSIA